VVDIRTDDNAGRNQRWPTSPAGSCGGAGLCGFWCPMMMVTEAGSSGRPPLGAIVQALLLNVEDVGSGIAGGSDAVTCDWSPLEYEFGCLN
jgi:hypothetical protein